MNWYLKVMNQYLDFNGRARRQEYWMFILFHIIFIVVAIVLDGFIGSSFASDNSIGFIYLAYILLTFIPSLAVSVRRMHDIGKSGWWYLINLIPLVGPIWFLVLTCMEGESRANQWGNNPKGRGNDSSIDLIGRE